MYQSGQLRAARGMLATQVTCLLLCSFIERPACLFMMFLFLWHISCCHALLLSCMVLMIGFVHMSIPKTHARSWQECAPRVCNAAKGCDNARFRMCVDTLLAVSPLPSLQVCALLAASRLLMPPHAWAARSMFTLFRTEHSRCSSELTHSLLTLFVHAQEAEAGEAKAPQQPQGEARK